jgi:hypothetical protein
MGVTRDTWRAEFHVKQRLSWPCPACSASPLRLVPDSLRDGETSESKMFHDHPGWEPEGIDGRFVALMDCAHCGNVVGVAGIYRIVDDRHYDEDVGESGDYEKYYRPTFFTESPRIIDLPDATPEDVVGELLASFRLFWCDAFGCTNRLRSAVEQLLTEQKIARTYIDKDKHKRKPIPLHGRIERYQKKQPQIARRLMAAKWIGNAGSHGNPVTAEDALDAYELMDWVLDALYARRHKSTALIMQTVNKKRAPRSNRRR